MPSQVSSPQDRVTQTAPQKVPILPGGVSLQLACSEETSSTNASATRALENRHAATCLPLREEQPRLSGARPSQIDPNVWSGRASQEVFVELAVNGLASMYPAFDWSSLCSW